MVIRKKSLCGVIDLVLKIYFMLHYTKKGMLNSNKASAFFELGSYYIEALFKFLSYYCSFVCRFYFLPSFVYEYTSCFYNSLSVKQLVFFSGEATLFVFLLDCIFGCLSVILRWPGFPYYLTFFPSLIFYYILLTFPLPFLFLY